MAFQIRMSPYYFSCYCFVAPEINLKPKNQKKIIPNLEIVVRENALAIGGTVVPPSEYHCKILYLLKNQSIKADLRGYTFFDVFTPLSNTLIDTRIWVYETIK